MQIISTQTREYKILKELNTFMIDATHVFSLNVESFFHYGLHSFEIECCTACKEFQLDAFAHK